MTTRTGCSGRFGVPGREGNARSMGALFASFPDWAVGVEDLITEGDRVVRTVQRGTHEGEFFGIPPTGKRVSFSAIAVYRLEGDAIAEEWGALRTRRAPEGRTVPSWTLVDHADD